MVRKTKNLYDPNRPRRLEGKQVHEEETFKATVWVARIRGHFAVV